MKKKPGVIAGYAMKYDAGDCIGCNLCVRDCPTGAIKIINVGTKEDKKFECHLDLGHCIFCAQCVDSCRKGCLAFTQDIELAVMDRDEFKVKL